MRSGEARSRSSTIESRLNLSQFSALLASAWFILRQHLSRQWQDGPRSSIDLVLKAQDSTEREGLLLDHTGKVSKRNLSPVRLMCIVLD